MSSQSKGDTSAIRNDSSPEQPVGPLATKAGFGSDIVAETLRALDLPYIALNPGAS